ncbi:MAG: hypothetical protein K0R53_1057 [Burkholderiales bacterium]|jgi:hypothetical protein|nr:hypothetical protein [Burkholderiales bacterium]
MSSRDRSREWFVPAFGPRRFRTFVGLLFLPYTGMVLSYVVIGSMLAQTIHWDRVGALVAIYFLALGIGAHALDAVGSSGPKPWGQVFSRAQLWALAIVAIVAAYAMAIYYMVLYVPLLWLIAIPEGFFVFAYNLEWFKGRFHTDAWFAFSWGALPVLAGYVLQTNSVSAAALIVAASMGLLSLVEIKASRPYKEMKRSGADASLPQARHLEAILKSVSLGVILLGAGVATWRWLG